MSQTAQLGLGKCGRKPASNIFEHGAASHAAFCILDWQAQAPREQVLCKGAVMKRALFWGTIVAGAVAAYLMYRRGEGMGTIAVRTVTNPIGSLVSELQTASD
jgi:hypothetical protein